MIESMTAWCLPAFVFLVWWVWVVACACGAARRDAECGVPEAERRGTSVLPGFPLFPLVFCAAAWGIDQAISPWGSVGVGGAHVLLAIVFGVSIIRDQQKIRSIDAAVQQAGGAP